MFATDDIRNYLVHYGIWVPKLETIDDKKHKKRVRRIRQLARATDGIEIDDIQLKIAKEYCNRMINTLS